MRHVIVGYGNAGKALGMILKYLNTDFEVFDIAYRSLLDQGVKITHNFSESFVHICTPEYVVRDVVKKVSSGGARYVLIHSTMPIGETRKAQNETNIPIALMPLFFREKRIEDIYKPHRIILGLPNADLINDKRYQAFYEFAKSYATKTGALIKVYKYETAEIIKLATNGIRATLILLYNELFKIAKEFQCEEEFKNAIKDVLNIINVTTWERDSYPWGNNPDLLGLAFSGSCLPKDVGHLKKYSKFFEIVGELNETYPKT